MMAFKGKVTGLIIWWDTAILDTEILSLENWPNIITANRKRGGGTNISLPALYYHQMHKEQPQNKMYRKPPKAMIYLTDGQVNPGAVYLKDVKNIFVIPTLRNTNTEIVKEAPNSMVLRINIDK